MEQKKNQVRTAAEIGVATVTSERIATLPVMALASTATRQHTGSHKNLIGMNTK
jgi:hypothetical protein